MLPKFVVFKAKNESFIGGTGISPRRRTIVSMSSKLKSWHIVPIVSLLSLANACAHSGTTPVATQGELRQEQPAVEALLKSYEVALNASDAETITGLYAQRGVFMAQHRSAAVGQAAVAQAYREIFSQIDLDITFEFDEVTVVTETLAYARTRSRGKTKVKAAGIVVKEANQELFILSRTDRQSPWRIGRYIFATTQPR